MSAVMESATTVVARRRRRPVPVSAGCAIGAWVPASSSPRCPPRSAWFSSRPRPTSAPCCRPIPFIGDSDTLAVVVGLLSVLLTAVAMYVAAIVTANTFSTIIAGRTRQIALMRLIGATARSQRAEVGRQGFVVGVIGAALGLLAGLGIAAVGVQIGRQLDRERAGGLLARLSPSSRCRRSASRSPPGPPPGSGSRRVLSVTPLQAIGGSVERTHDEVSRRRPPRRRLGAADHGRAAARGGRGGRAGALRSVSSSRSSADCCRSRVSRSASVLFMPPVLRLVGRMFGSSATARLAAENALRYPERSSRMAIGVVMGVTLVTMFAVALESVKQMLIEPGRGRRPRRVLRAVRRVRRRDDGARRRLGGDRRRRARRTC